MKISTSQLFNRSVRDIQDNQSQLSNTREKLATGKNLIRASDDTTKLNTVDTLERFINKSKGYENTINVLVSEEELNERKGSWKAPALREKSGSLYKYAKMVSSASEGCVTDAF